MRHRDWILILFLLPLGQPLAAQTVTPLEKLWLVGDIEHLHAIETDALDGISDHQLEVIDWQSGLHDVDSPFGDLAGAAIDGFSPATACGPALYSLDIAHEIDGLFMQRADVFDSAGMKLLDAESENIPSAVNVVAISRSVDCDLVISLDIGTELDGQYFSAGQLILWDATGFSAYTNRLANANIDALHILSNRRLLFSTDHTTELPGLGLVSDDDVIEYHQGGHYLLSFSPALTHSSWEKTDLVALAAVQAISTPGDFSWQTSQVSVAEGDGEVVLQLNRANGSDGEVTLVWSTVDVSADDNDYSGGSDSVIFADGQTSAMISIPIVDDAEHEPDQSFSVRINSVSNGANFTDPRVVTVTITDDDPDIQFGQIQFARSGSRVWEDVEQIELEVVRINGSEQAVSVDWRTQALTATAGQDYTSASGSLQFADGQVQQTISIDLIDDSLFEGLEQFELILENVTGGASLGSSFRMVIEIVDNEEIIFLDDFE